MEYGEGGVMLWQKAALQVSRYIVLKSTTRSMPQRQAGYNNAIQAAWDAAIYVFIQLPICRISNLRSRAWGIDSLVPKLELILVLCFAKY